MTMEKLIAPTIALLAGISFAAPAAAPSFGERVARAKQRSAQPEGAAYELKLGPALTQAMQTCIPPGSSSPDNLGTFTLVAWVAPDGRQTDVTFQPETKVSRCIGAEFSRITLPPPPQAAKGDPGYPIEIDMRVVN